MSLPALPMSEDFIADDILPLSSMQSPPRGGAASSAAAAGGSGGKPAGGKKAARKSTHDDGTPTRVRKRAAPKLGEDGKPIPPKRRKKNDDPSADGGVGGSGGKKRAAPKRAAPRNTTEGGGAVGAPGPGGAPGEVRVRGPARQRIPLIGREEGPFHPEIMRLMSACGVVNPTPESACVLEEILLEYLATLTERMLAVPSVAISSDALQTANMLANSADGSGVAATSRELSTPLRMDTLLFALRDQPTHYARVKEIWKAVLQQQEADGIAKKTTSKAKQ